MTYKKAVYKFDMIERALGFSDGIIRAVRNRCVSDELPPSFIVGMALDKMRLDCKNIDFFQACNFGGSKAFKLPVYRGD
jgi:hypothetical protein